MFAVGSAYWILRDLDFSTGSKFKYIFSIFENPLGSLLLVSDSAYFGFGIILWSIVNSGSNSTKVVTSICCVVAGVINTASSARYNIALHNEPMQRIIIAPILYGFEVIFITVAVLYNKSISKKLARTTNIIKLAGLLTYPLYLVHSEVGAHIVKALACFGSWGAFGVGLMSAIIISAIVLLIEIYLLRSILSFSTRSLARRVPITDLP